MGLMIYGGTGRGVIAINEQNGDWSIGRRRFVPDWEITQLLVRPNGQLVASTRGDGVWFQLDHLGKGMQGGWDKPNYGKPGPGKTHAIVIDPQDPDTIYAGTEPIGLWVTHDAGKSWEELPGLRAISGIGDITYPAPMVEPHVRHLAIDPSNRDVLYASLQVGHIAKSTDRGVTWTRYDGGIDADVHTIVVHPKNSDKLFAATGGHGFREGLTKGRALYTSDDGGKTWSPMATEFTEEYSLPLIMHPANPDILFSALGTDYPPLWRRPEGANGRLITSRDGGRTWQQITLPDADVGPTFPGSICFDPADANEMFMCAHKGAFYRSHNGGTNWDRVPLDIGQVGDLAEIGLSDMKIFHV